MIRERDAQRVGQWIDEAVASGAKLVTGGSRAGAMFAPTLLADVTPEMKVSREELFGPAVGVARASDIQEAIRLANDSRYGLSAGIFTRDIDAALRFARECESGNIHINWGPAWRADLMPYGGLKESGVGREGPKYAILEMTEMKTVVVHLDS
jgi:glyceraldehyde-3-phosphate dehydrogenase (NADP+)